MRLYHFSLIFAVLAVAMLTLTSVSVRERSLKNSDIAFLDRALDRAADSAAEILSCSEDEGLENVRNEAAEMFFEALAATLGLTGNTPATEKLRTYVPLIVVSDGNTAYIYTEKLVRSQNGELMKFMEWSEPVEGDAESINSTIERCANENNNIARQFGIRYGTSIDDETGKMFVREGGRVMFAALFQDYPMEKSSGGCYNRFTFAGSGVMLKERYYINIAGEGYASPMYWHREDCSLRAGESVSFISKKECALAGAFPCPICGGDGY